MAVVISEFEVVPQSQEPAQASRAEPAPAPAPAPTPRDIDRIMQKLAERAARVWAH